MMKIVSVISKKKQFRNLCLNYELNKYNEIWFRKLKKIKNRFNKNKRKNRHLEKF